MSLLKTVIFQSVALIAIPSGFCCSTANALSLPGFTSQQLQRIARDITPTNSQDFFRRGQAQIEREVRLLHRRGETSPRPILKIDPVNRDQNQQIPDFFQQDRLYLNQRPNLHHR